MSYSEERAARNEMLFREVNESIEELSERIRRTDSFAILCECSNRACLEGIEIQPADYRAVRAHPLHFIVAPGHERLAIEQLVERGPGYLVVEKIGAAAIVVRGQAA